MTQYVQETSTIEFALVDDSGNAQQTYTNEQVLVVSQSTIILTFPAFNLSIPTSEPRRYVSGSRSQFL